MDWTPCLPGATLGVLGGGQLGRMWVQEAQRMGYQTLVLDPDEHCPAGQVSHHLVCGDYDEDAALAALSKRCVAVTTEFENVPAQALAKLAQHTRVSPQAHAVAVAQDRAAEKAHFVECGVPVAAHAVIDSEAALQNVAPHLLPGILKTARMGYDGKGQIKVESPQDLQAAWQQLGQVPCVLEKRLDLVDECSVIVARGHDGAMVHLPVQRNLHRDGILAVTEVWPGNLPDDLSQAVVQAAQAVAQGLGYVGVLCVEFFVLADGRWVVNEIAPRPHNSGHHSQDACDVSQFELQLRCMAGLPLTQPRLHSPVVMLNLLGDLWRGTASQDVNADDPAHAPDWARVLALPGAHLHLYGKKQARVGRKMGHLNITADTPERARAAALQAAALLGIAGF